MPSPFFAMALDLDPVTIGVIVIAALLVLGANVFFGIKQREEQLDKQNKK